MDKQHDDGGMAFPKTGSFDDRSGEYDSVGQDGMTLRDYFAAKAMQGLCWAGEISDHGNIAREAYAIADAMIAERKKGQDNG